jgi:hypothetical protein
VLTSAETLARLAAGTLDVGLVALPQSPVAGLQHAALAPRPGVGLRARRLAGPAAVTPAWLAARPLILNDAARTLSRLTADWFARAGQQPRARIELNYNDAIKSLVAAGYGAALLPHEAGAPSRRPRAAAAAAGAVAAAGPGLARRRRRRRHAPVLAVLTTCAAPGGDRVARASAARMPSTRARLTPKSLRPMREAERTCTTRAAGRTRTRRRRRTSSSASGTARTGSRACGHDGGARHGRTSARSRAMVAGPSPRSASGAMRA